MYTISDDEGIIFHGSYNYIINIWDNKDYWLKDIKLKGIVKLKNTNNVEDTQSLKLPTESLQAWHDILSNNE